MGDTATVRLREAAALVGVDPESLEGLPEDVAHLEHHWPRLFEVLLRRRSRDWLPRIDQMLDEPGDAFVLVGMSHLTGNDSALQLLTGAGTRTAAL